MTAKLQIPGTRRLAFYCGLATLAALSTIEWPVAVARAWLTEWLGAEGAWDSDVHEEALSGPPKLRAITSA